MIMTALRHLQRRTSRALRRAIARLPRRLGHREAQITADAALSADRKRWRFVEREAVLVSRLGCELSGGNVSEEERAAAVEHIVRAATRLKQFAEGRLRLSGETAGGGHGGTGSQKRSNGANGENEEN